MFYAEAALCALMLAVVLYHERRTFRRSWSMPERRRLLLSGAGAVVVALLPLAAAGFLMPRILSKAGASVLLISVGTSVAVLAAVQWANVDAARRYGRHMLAWIDHYHHLPGSPTYQPILREREPTKHARPGSTLALCVTTRANIDKQLLTPAAATCSVVPLLAICVVVSHAVPAFSQWLPGIPHNGRLSVWPPVTTAAFSVPVLVVSADLFRRRIRQVQFWRTHRWSEEPVWRTASPELRSAVYRRPEPASGRVPTLPALLPLAVVAGLIYVVFVLFGLAPWTWGASAAKVVCVLVTAMYGRRQVLGRPEISQWEIDHTRSTSALVRCVRALQLLGLPLRVFSILCVCVGTATFGGAFGLPVAYRSAGLAANFAELGLVMAVVGWQLATFADILVRRPVQPITSREVLDCLDDPLVRQLMGALRTTAKVIAFVRSL